VSIDYGAMERQFLETLKADSGRSLEEWMAAIAAAGLTERNDIIDWLRRQGFLFSKASWIERIHNNGGRPIYEGTSTARMRTLRRQAIPRRTEATPMPAAPQPPVAPLSAVTASQTSSTATPDPAALEALLARAKAYRPLAVYVIAEIRKAVPAVTLRLVDGGVIFTAGARDFAALAVSGKDLRLGLALAAPLPGVALEAARLTLRPLPTVTHMIVLTDARQITPALLAGVAHAATDP